MVLIVDANKVLAGDLSVAAKLAQDYTTLKEQIDTLVIPDLTVAKVTQILLANKAEITKEAAQLQDCEGYDCSVAAGKIIAIFLKFSVNTDEMLTDTNVPEFFRGMFDGIGHYDLKAMDAELKKIIVDTKKVVAGDLSVAEKLANEYVTLKGQVDSLTIPDLTAADITRILANLTKETVLVSFYMITCSYKLKHKQMSYKGDIY
jgi:hypothetical protein